MKFSIFLMLLLAQSWALGDPHFIPGNPSTPPGREKVLDAKSSSNETTVKESIQEEEENEKEEYRFDTPPEEDDDKEAP